MESEYKYLLIYYDNGEQKIFKGYKNEKEVLEDIYYKDPAAFFIADTKSKIGMTINEFIEKYNK